MPRCGDNHPNNRHILRVETRSYQDTASMRQQNLRFKYDFLMWDLSQNTLLPHLFKDRTVRDDVGRVGRAIVPIRRSSLHQKRGAKALNRGVR